MVYISAQNVDMFCMKNVHIINISNVQKDIHVYKLIGHLKNYLVKIYLNLNVKSVMRSENIKMGLLSAQNVNILCMNNVLM